MEADSLVELDVGIRSALRSGWLHYSSLGTARSCWVSGQKDSTEMEEVAYDSRTAKYMDLLYCVGVASLHFTGGSLAGIQLSRQEGKVNG